MNKDYLLWHLKEAKEELDRTIVEIEESSDYDVGEYLVAMSHLYHHINTAWNARDAPNDEAAECSEENFKKWRKLPQKSELLL